MKRFALLLLAFTMLFVMASAEESFVEEDFAVAASFDDEFFAEETFFGDEFEAEQPEVEGEVEDRSVYLFEDELVHTAKKDPWQDWNINLSVKSLKKNKVTLQWTIDKAYGEASGQPNRSAQPSEQHVPTTYKAEKKALKGVKFYVYQVDPVSGVATQVKKPTTKQTFSVSVKNPGTYYYYVTLERVVKKSAEEDYGKASNKLEVTFKEGDIKNATAISKVKAYASVEPSVQPTSDQPAFVSIDVFTKKAVSSYTIEATQKLGKKDVKTYKGTYTPSDDEKDEVQGRGYIHIDLANDVTNWNDKSAQPEFIAGKKITVTVTGTNAAGKAKKGSVTPKKITAKTQPVIMSVEQIDEKKIKIAWSDPAAVAAGQKEIKYDFKVGKDVHTVTTTRSEDATYTTEMVLDKSIAKLKKAKTLKITVKSNVPKSKKSKAYKFTFAPVGFGAILNAKVEKNADGGMTLTWNGIVKDAAYEVYVTDSKNTRFGSVAELTYASAQPSGQQVVKLFSAEFTADDLAEMKNGWRLSFTIKAVQGTKVLERKVINYGGLNPYNPSVQASEQSEQPSAQKK